MRYWYFPFFAITFFWLKFKSKRIYRKVKIKNIDIPALDRYKVVRKIITRFFFLCKIKLVITGKENYSSKKHYLIVSNHQTNFDPLIMFKVFNEDIFAIIAKHELLKNFFANSFMKIIYSFVIKRDNLRQTLDVFDKAREFMVVNKKSLIIFPEGTRSKKTEMNQLKPGAFKIAYQTNCNILPVVIKNSCKINFKIFKKTQNIYISILKPISYHSFINTSTTNLSNNIQELMQTNINK